MKTLHSIDHKLNAKVTGAFFIMATVTAIIGLKLYDPILVNSDYLVSGVKSSDQIVWGAIFESMLAISAVGTAIMMFPYLKKFNESWGLGYVCFRLLEVIFILVGIISMLSILTLSHEYINPTTTTNISSFQTSAKILKTIHDWTFIFGPHFMLGINTFIYSMIFFQSGLVPKRLSILGIAGALLILTGAILEMFGIISSSAEIILLAIPIALYEMILAVWLIIKGFNLDKYETAD